MTFRTAPHTIHLVHHDLTRLDGAVQAFCGRRGVAYQPTASAWQHCRACRKEAKAAKT